MAEFIVAIELGSSSIRGIAGKKNPDGSISVQALVKEDASQCIRKGVVYNIDKTAVCLKSIVSKLRKTLKFEITHVYVGVGGQSVRSVRNIIVKDLPSETIIGSDVVYELMDANRSMNYPEQEILDAATQEYKTDNQYTLDPVGIKATRLEGNFLNILLRKTFYNNLNTCFDKAGIAIAEIYLAPLVLADSVLTESEKRGGCVLIDMGADTTTTAVYYKGLLRHLAVIPLGSDNITKDIASYPMEEREADQLKLRYASAYTETSDIDPTLTYPINSDQSIESHKLIEIVEARVEEIIKNVWHQVPAEYIGKLLGGIVITGGGSNMKNMELAFKRHTGMEKIRQAHFVGLTIKSNNEDIKKRDATLNTIIGLLAKGDMNCAGQSIDAPKDLFGETGTTGQTTSTTSSATPETQTQTVTKKEEETKTEETKTEETGEPKGGFFRKFAKRLKNFGGKIMEPEE